MKVLFAASEALPLVKTGGLADVAGALPGALAALGVDIRVVLPAYRGTLDKLESPTRLGELKVRGQPFVIWQGRVPGSPVLHWLIDYPPLYGREGDPYHSRQHQPWPDNAWRYGCFAEAVARLALGEGTGGWKADVVHGNDWQTGLTAAWLKLRDPSPRFVFTIHNLAYSGLFPRSAFEALGLPPGWWAIDGLEFHGQMSMLKAGLYWADAITTVSPNYAREIRSPRFGHGFDGLLEHLSPRLSGILNGIDDAVWNPATDGHLAQTYTASSLRPGKAANRAALSAELGLSPGLGHESPQTLIGIIGRLTEQKGFDVVLQALPELMQLPIQLAMLGAGEPELERGFAKAVAQYPGRIGLKLGYDEGLAHRIEAGADLFLMPSRFEPCGLNQMYSQRYGTVPVVHRVGGLADTVVDATTRTLKNGTATGVVFDDADAGGVLYGIRRALELLADPVARAGLQHSGMNRDFTWASSARQYLALYR
ncbi:glycogen synthase GlgA [Nevskia ramosa]|uniref:glycogen synthase GlgA n=1 Tax=Nevskia ramosa TaxID=64002 RepID=UPI0023554E77|nr:glycogen synthase GlgA [Nevskia ramosa]